MNQYSLTDMTILLEKHYNQQLNKINNKREILNYNNHKIRHIYSVLFVAQKIMTYEKEIFNNESIIKKSEIANLLHDIGRFYQNDWDKVLSWREFEHGDVGYEILKEEWITDLAILFAVKYHNKININWLYKEKGFISSDNQEEILSIVKIVRDADKLQNLEYMLFDSDNEIYICEDHNWKISNLVYKEFMEWKWCINGKNIKNYLDKFLYYASWYFDLNYNITRKFLINDGFIDFIGQELKKHWLENNLIKNIKNKLLFIKK